MYVRFAPLEPPLPLPDDPDEPELDPELDPELNDPPPPRFAKERCAKQRRTRDNGRPRIVGNWMREDFTRCRGIVKTTSQRKVDCKLLNRPDHIRKPEKAKLS